MYTSDFWKIDVAERQYLHVIKVSLYKNKKKRSKVRRDFEAYCKIYPSFSTRRQISFVHMEQKTQIWLYSNRYLRSVYFKWPQLWRHIRCGRDTFQCNAKLFMPYENL